MDDKRVADYFVVAGLPDNHIPLEEFTRDGSSPKTNHTLVPITDITVIIRSQGEVVPPGYTCIETTQFGFPADLNHGSLRSPSIYLCYRRGRDKPPLVDIGVLYEGKERVMADSEVVHTTPYGRPANVNNSGSRTFLTYRRASENAPCNQLVVTDICVILANKGETPPHAFCLINKNLNKGMVGSDVFLCYKKSMNRPDLLCFKPGILGRFPFEDYESFPLPESVPLFCLPMGATIECWPRKAYQPRPVFSTFVLTSDSAEKVYGAAVTFYERIHPAKVKEKEKKQLSYVTDEDRQTKTLNANKAICLLSRWPFFDTFEKFLLYLYKMSLTGPHKVPLERYISHFMLDVPFPSPQRPRILIQLAEDVVSLAQPEDTPLPLSGASFSQLLRNLGPDNCLHVLLFAITEQKMLFHSLRPDVLTSVAEAVVMLIFPFHWQCPYIPLCPLGLSDVLNAPLPFIVGVDSRYFDLYDPPHDVACIDLDTNSIYLSEDKRGLSIKLLPKRPARILRSTLQAIFEKMHKVPPKPVTPSKAALAEMAPFDHSFRAKKREHQIELEIQEAFLRFMASILKGFRSYLLPITCAPTEGATDPSSLCDLQGFLKSRDKAYHRFFMMMMKTQMFIRFIEERSFVSDKDASLAFFDECTEKIDAGGEYGETRLLEIDDSQQNDRTVFIAPPEPTGLPPNAEYRYHGFGKLNPQLFHRHPPRQLLNVASQSNLQPSSPMSRRTKQEIKSAQKTAKKHAESPMMWAKCLVGYCYSLWFTHLPAYTKCSTSKAKALRIAYDVLVRMQSLHLHPPDEVCYRVLMLLCGLYSQPVLAVKVLFEMKRNGVQPNAITYGYYNKAVLESKWPSGDTSATLLWNKLRNVILGVAHFRKCGQKRAQRSLSIYSESEYDSVSRGSTDSCTVAEGDKGNAVEIATPDISKVDDQSSSGIRGQSDGGYCSLHQDDNQKPSTSSSSLLNVDSSGAGIPNGPVKHPVKSAFKDPNACRECNAHRTLRFEAVDFSASDEFRSRVGSIVRSSASSLGSLTCIHDANVESPAGVLMTSHGILKDDSVFADDVLVNGTTTSFAERVRRRHRSAGDPKAYKFRQCSGPLSEVEPPRQFLRSHSFGNDAQIIRKLRDVTLKSLKEDMDRSSCERDVCGLDDVEDTSANVFGLSRCDEEPETELELEFAPSSLNMPSESTRPRSPNIPIKTPVQQRSESIKSDDVFAVDSDGSNGSPCIGGSGSTNNTPRERDFLTSTFSPLKEAWLNWDGLLGNSLPRVASSLTTSLGIGTNGAQHSSRASSGSKVTRSSTFHCPSDTSEKKPLILRRMSKADDSIESADILKKPLSRSSTLPVPPSPKTSVKPVDKTPIRPSSVSGAATFGLSRITGGKHSEYLFGSLKSAASSVATKITEFRHSLSSTSTAEKGLSSSLPRPYDLDKLPYEDDDRSSNSSDCRRYSVDYLSRSTRSDEFLLDESTIEREGLSGGSSFPLYELLQSHYSENLDQSGTSTRIAMEITLTTCSKCYTCAALLYDEEIMEGWSADDSNLNTQCTFCKAKVVPLLTIIVRDLRHEGSQDSLLTPACSSESIRSTPSIPPPPSSDSGIRSSSIHQPPPVHPTAAAATIAETLQRQDPALRRSIDSGQDAFILFEDSPDNGSINNESYHSTPMDSPLKQNHVNGTAYTLPGFSSTRPIVICPQRNFLREGTDDLLNHDGPLNTQPDMNGSMKNSLEDVLMVRLESNGKQSVVVESSSSAAANSPGLLSFQHMQNGSHPPSSSTPASHNPSISITSNSSAGGDGKKVVFSEDVQLLEPITVPYLSPLVLRKEVENVLEHEGDNCLTGPDFVDQHPIIYWNLIWFFKRINVPSHLPKLALNASTITKNKQIPEKWKDADQRNVVVRCLWDNVKHHEDLGQPMYVLWSQSSEPSPLLHALVTDERRVSRGAMRQILASVQCNDLITPMKLLINERRKWRSSTGRHHSIYRDLLFLSFTAIGKENIDEVAFDREYRKAFDSLMPKEQSSLSRNDKPPEHGAVFCRRFFKELELRPL